MKTVATNQVASFSYELVDKISAILEDLTTDLNVLSFLPVPKTPPELIPPSIISDSSCRREVERLLVSEHNLVSHHFGDSQTTESALRRSLNRHDDSTLRLVSRPCVTAVLDDPTLSRRPRPCPSVIPFISCVQGLSTVFLSRLSEPVSERQSREIAIQGALQSQKRLRSTIRVYDSWLKETTSQRHSQVTSLNHRIAHLHEEFHHVEGHARSTLIDVSHQATLHEVRAQNETDAILTALRSSISDLRHELESLRRMNSTAEREIQIQRSNLESNLSDIFAMRQEMMRNTGGMIDTFKEEFHRDVMEIKTLKQELAIMKSESKRVNQANSKRSSGVKECLLAMKTIGNVRKILLVSARKARARMEREKKLRRRRRRRRKGRGRPGTAPAGLGYRVSN